MNKDTVKVKIGDKIKVLYMKDDPTWNKNLTSENIGVVEDISEIEIFNQTQIWVLFDNGIRLAILDGIDQYQIVK